MNRLVTIGALRPGDILLSLGEGELSSTIRLLDGGSYSHAALFTGSTVIEATEPDVIEHELSTSLRTHARLYVDAFRHRGPAELGQAAVLSARQYVGRSYSYGDLFLGGVVVALSARFPGPHEQVGFLAAAARLMKFLDLDRVSEDGLVTCVELVVRAYAAGAAPLLLQLQGERAFAGAALAAGVRELAGRVRSKGDTATEEASEWQRLQERFRGQYRELLPDAVQTKAWLWSDPRELPLEVRAGIDWPPNLVTPRDLECCPTLERLGRIFSATEASTTAHGSENPAILSPLR